MEESVRFKDWYKAQFKNASGEETDLEAVATIAALIKAAVARSEHDQD